VREVANFELFYVFLSFAYLAVINTVCSKDMLVEFSQRNLPPDWVKAKARAELVE
jgi:hypothetical protein